MISKNESTVQGWERVRTLYQSEDPYPKQPIHGMKKKKIVGDKKKEQIGIMTAYKLFSVELL